jgi:hypothetical protein
VPCRAGRFQPLWSDRDVTKIIDAEPAYDF